MTSTFQQAQTTAIVENGFTFGVCEWSTPANWVGGVPTNGAVVAHNVTLAGNPSGYDDIGSLFLDSLALNAGQIAVGGSLEIGAVSFGAANFPSVFSDTLLGSSAATLVIDGFSGVNFGEIGAFGTNSLTVIQSATDTGGETYQVDDGGELVLNPTPQYNSSVVNAGYFYENSVATGTFAFRNPSGTIGAPLAGVAIGDSIALPGSDVSSVTFGAGSIRVVTNLGTTTFSNVSYSGTHPTGFTVSADPTGLQRITFAAQQATAFQQSQTTTIINSGFTFGVYEWSTAANWTNGVPGSGAAVAHNITVVGNPSGYDDISGLYLDSLAVSAGQVAVGGSLEIGAVSFGTANFPSVFSDTLLGSSAATLVIDGFSGANFGEIGAFGTNALTVVQSPTDTGGETYQVDDGGELVLDPTPQYNSSVINAGYFYENSVATGTFAFRNPGGTIAAPLAGVAIGDSIALPGSDASSVTFGTSTIKVVTNLGTTTFGNVSYSGTHPTGFTVSADPTGLQRITFASQQATAFQQSQTTTIINSGFTFGVYEWSTSANWTNGVPGAGAAVTHNIAVAGNPSGYDDIAGLYLDSLALNAGQIAVGGSLEIGSISFGTANFPSVFSDTLLGSSAATLVVDGFSGANFGEIGAFGPNALTVVQSPTDTGGETYQVDDGGELVLNPTPQYNSSIINAGYFYENSVANGTFAFRNPGGTIAAPLAGVAVGDAIALPGSDVSSVTFGASSIGVVTNLGTTVFSNVGYVSNEVFTGFISSPDPLTGLERITFEGYATTSFQQSQTTTIINNGFTFGVYEWSTPANWTNGVPTNGEGVIHNITVAGNPSGYDNIASLNLASVVLTAGQIAVGGSLEVGTLSFGTANFPSIFADTLLGSSAATLMIDGFSGANFGEIGAFGTNALTVVQSPADPGGETYQVDDGGELVLDPIPQYNSLVTSAGYFYENSVATGTFAFRNPGSLIAAPLAGVAIGDAIALPGTSVSSVTFGSNTITAVTNLGTTVFSNVSYSGAMPTAFAASADPITGLERITFATTTAFLQTTTATVGSTTQYLWSNAANWTNGVPVNGSTVTFSVSAASLGGYDNIGNLFVGHLFLNSGYLAVGGTLTVGSLMFSEAGGRGIEADTLINGGSVAVTIDAMTNSGATIAALGSAARTDVLASFDPGEIYQAGSSGMVLLSATPRSTSSFDFNGGTFAFANPGSGIASALDNVAVGDAIELPGTSVSSVLFGANSLTITTDAGITTFSDVSYGVAAPGAFAAGADASTGLEEVTFTLCFRAGTMIRTLNGDVPVERLSVGDDVLTANGDVRPTVWIGHRRIDCAHHPRPRAVWPVRISAGALGEGRPQRDLWLSPEHAVFVDGVLVPVKHLIDGEWIVQVPVHEVTYYHVELGQHDVLLAEGLAAESYLDTGDRPCFDDGGVVRLVPEFRADGMVTREWESRACAPLVVAGDKLEAIRAGLKPAPTATRSTTCSRRWSRSAAA